MAIPTYSINAGTQVHGVISSWQRVPKKSNADGTTTFSDWSLNTWRVSTMEEDRFIELQDALRANPLTSVETNDIDDRNSNKTYTSAILEAVGGDHLALNMVSVTVQFRIDTTA